MQNRIDNHVLPAFGDTLAIDLTSDAVESWLDMLARSAPLTRSKRNGARQTRDIDLKQPEVVRRRRTSANKSLTILKAALNLAYRRGILPNDNAWRRVKPFRNVDAARIRFLSDDEARRLVNACPADFRRIVQGALLTGCRYGELRSMQASAYDRDGHTLFIAETKSGRPRTVYLTDEAVGLFEMLTAGQPRDALIFRRDDGREWRHAEQVRRMAMASDAGGIDPAASFHILRHTYASRLARAGVPMAVIAAQLGHADTRITEKHYAHLAPSYVADTVRAAFGHMGVVSDDEHVVRIV